MNWTILEYLNDRQYSVHAVPCFNHSIVSCAQIGARRRVSKRSDILVYGANLQLAAFKIPGRKWQYCERGAKLPARLADFGILKFNLLQGVGEKWTKAN